MTGNSVLTGTENNIDLSSLNAGVYVICIQTNEGYTTHKLIKQPH